MKILCLDWGHRSEQKKGLSLKDFFFFCLRGERLGMSDLVNKNAGHLVKLEFQVSN